MQGSRPSLFLLLPPWGRERIRGSWASLLGLFPSEIKPKLRIRSLSTRSARSQLSTCSTVAIQDKFRRPGGAMNHNSPLVFYANPLLP